MQHLEFEPPEELRDAIKCFWYDRREFGALQTDFEVVPDGYSEIIFHFGSGCSILQAGAFQALTSPFIVGLLNAPARFNTRERFEVIGVRCFPWAVFDLLGLPPWKSDVYVVDHPISGLQITLAEFVQAGKINDAVAGVRQYFMDTRLPSFIDDTVVKAGAAMTKTNGKLHVSEVASAAHATVRTLERKFKRSAGYSVKDVSGLMRFEQVRNRLWHFPNANIAGLAQEFGYADQSHLSRDFKRYTGTTPAAFARNAKTRKPYGGNDFVAFVQS